MTDTQSAEEPFDWTDLFELAKELAQREDEASLRCSVSRSYYAVFNIAREVLADLDPDYRAMRSKDSHKQVWDRMRALPQRQARTAERSGRSLLGKRKTADYVPHAGDWTKLTQQSLEEAKRAISALKDLTD